MSVTFQHRELANGLTVIAEVDPTAHSSAAGFFVRTGARDEPAELMGVSHFLEHMMFKGTETLTTEDINVGFDRLGASNNAYTSGEMTCFYAHTLPERLGEAVELLGTMMRPALREDDFSTEKSVILEEIAMYADMPFWRLYEATAAAHYRDHGLGYRVLGTPETIGPMTAGAMRAYFEHRYSADNTVLSLAGRVDFGRACDIAERVCGAWPRTGATRDSSTPAVGAAPVELADEQTGRGYALGMAPAPDARDPRRYAAMAASRLLGGSRNSRLHWALVDPGHAEEAESAYSAHEGAGDFLVYVSGDPDRLDEVWEIAAREAAGLAGSVDEDDLVRLRAKIASEVTLDGERPAGRMQRIGRGWTLTGEYRTLEEELGLIGAVDLPALRSVLGEFPMTPVTVGRMRPAKA